MIEFVNITLSFVTGNVVLEVRSPCKARDLASVASANSDECYTQERRRVNAQMLTGIHPMEMRPPYRETDE